MDAWSDPAVRQLSVNRPVLPNDRKGARFRRTSRGWRVAGCPRLAERQSEFQLAGKQSAQGQPVTNAWLVSQRAFNPVVGYGFAIDTMDQPGKP